MRKFDNIVQSETAPSTTSLWLKDDKLFYFNNGEWRQIITEKPSEPEVIKEVNEDNV